MGVLRIAAFRRLLVSYTLNEIGDSVALIALSILVYDETGSAWATTALFVSGRFLPATLVPLITARIDQLAVRKTLPALYLLEAALFAALAVTVDADFLLVAVLFITLLDATVALAARSLTRGAVALTLIPTGQLRQGNALMNIALGLSSTIGLALGGLIVSQSTVVAALEINAVSFVLVAVIVHSRSLDQVEPEHLEPFWQRFKSGVRFIRESRVLRTGLSFQAFALVLFTMVLPIEVVYVEETLDRGGAALGLLLGVWSAGILVGGLFFARIRERPILAIAAVATGLIGAAHLGMALTTSLGVACAFAIFGGIGNGMQWVSVTTFLQERTPEEMQTRLSSFIEGMAASMVGLGFVVGGALTALSSAAITMGVSGGAILLLTVVAIWLGPKAIRSAPAAASAS